MYSFPPRFVRTWLFTSVVLSWFLSRSSVFAQVEPAGKAEPTAKPEVSTAEFDPIAGVRVRSRDSEFQLHLASWWRATLLEPVGETPAHSFSVPLLRPMFQASLANSQLHILAQPELAGSSPQLLDLQLDWMPTRAIGLRMGQFRTPFSRAFLTPIVRLGAADRGLPSDTFRLGRDTGLMLFGELSEGTFEYAAGVFNGAPINQASSHRTIPMVVVRGVVNLGHPVPYDQVPSLELLHPSGVALGINGAFRQRTVPDDDETMSGPIEDSFHGGADITAAFGPFFATAEGYVRRTRLDSNETHDTDRGAFLQSGVVVLPQLLEVGGRLGVVFLRDDARTYEAFANVFWLTQHRALGHHVKATLAARALDADSTFPTPSSRQAVLQVQVWF